MRTFDPVKRWTCPHCGVRAGVPVRYGLPDAGAIAAAARGDLVLDGPVLTDDDPVRCCFECRAALWPAGVHAIPGAAGDLRVVLTGSTSRRLEASISGGDLVLAWTGPHRSEPMLRIDASDLDLVSVLMAVPLMRRGRRLERWLTRRGLGFVGEIDGVVDQCTFTNDGCVSFSGPGGDLLVHSSSSRLVLQLVSHAFRRQGYRSIAEFHGWLTGVGVEVAHVG